MRDFIHCNVTYSTNANLDQQALFQAQQHYNRTDHPSRVVKWARFAPGGIEVEFEYVNPCGDEDRIRKAMQENQAAIDAMSVDEEEADKATPDDQMIAARKTMEQTAPPDPPIDEPPPETPGQDKEIKAVDGKVICPICGTKKYNDNVAGRRWLVKHMEKCDIKSDGK